MPRQQLQARSDGRYSCRLGDKYFYGSSPTAAQKKRDGYVKELTLGFYPDLADTEFLDYAALWLKVYRAKCNSRQKRQYETMIEYAAEALAKPYLRTINATDIQMLFNSLEGMSASYIKKFCTTIRSIFRAAVQDGVIVRTPADMAKPPEGTSGEHRCLEQWEQNLIVDTYNEHDFGPCAMAMMFAGLRRGEALYLNIDRDVDFEHRIITVRGAASFSEGNQAIETDGKTDAAQRVIPLNDCLAEALKGRHGLLLHKQDGSMMSLTSFVRKYESYISFLETRVNGCHKRWYGKTKEHKRLLEEGKKLPPWKDIRIRCHDFRVTFATMCYEADVPIKTLQRWLGHTDPTVLMKFYAKLTSEKEQFDIQRLNDVMNKRFGG